MNLFAARKSDLWWKVRWSRYAAFARKVLCDYTDVAIDPLARENLQAPFRSPNVLLLVILRSVRFPLGVS